MNSSSWGWEDDISVGGVDVPDPLRWNTDDAEDTEGVSAMGTS